MSAEPASAEPATAPKSAALLKRISREALSFSFWQGTGQLVLFATNILLARLLSPGDFGLYDICGFFLMFGGLLGDAGLGAALVRKPSDPTPEEYESVFVANTLVGTTLSLGFAVATPLLVRAYKLDHLAVWVLLAMAPGYLLGALRSYPMIRLERSLKFGFIARLELGLMFLRQISAATLALLGAGVWALVVANIATWFLHTVALLVLVPGLPKPRFHARVFWPLLRFGLSVQGLGLLAFFKDNVSNTLLGVLAGTTSVGLFNFGLRYIQIPVLAVNVMARIQLPAYARLQTDPDGLFRALQGVLRISFVLGVPFLLVLVTGASWLVPVIYSAKWAPSIPVAWAFAINMMGGLAASPLFSLLQARGEAGLALWVFLGWTLGTWVLSAAAWFTGLSLEGIAAAHSVVTTVVVVALLARTGRAIGRSLFPALAVPTLAGAAGLGVHLLLRRLPAPWADHVLVLLLPPFATFLAVELVLEGKRVLGELRSLRGSTTGSPPEEQQA